MENQDPEMHPDVASAVMEARERGIESAAEILSRNDMLSSDAIADHMGISSPDVMKAAKANTLLVVEAPDGKIGYPSWQLDNVGIRRAGLTEVLELIGNGWDAYRFFLAQTEGEDKSNRDRLINGEVEDLRSRAKMWASDNYG